jgi:hypothetical protein
LNILALQEKESSPNKKSTSQKTTNKKIYIAFVDVHCKTFSNSNWPEVLIQNTTIYVETRGKISALSNS